MADLTSSLRNFVTKDNSLGLLKWPLIALSGLGLISVASGIRRAYNYLRVKDSGLDAYAALNTSPEPFYLKELFDVTLKKTSTPMMITGVVEGRFLEFLVFWGKPKKILEIGCFTGYSALWMAEQLPEDGKIITMDLDPKVSAIAKENFLKSPHGEKIEHRLGDARQAVTSLNEKFDLIFIDADKGGYIHYYQTIMTRGLLAENGLIVVDNTFFMGGAANPILNHVGPFKEINEFNKLVRSDPRVVTVQLSIRDGVTLIRHAKN
eukprot:TRINITY_DN898_c0_g1_i1.p1 TRINITY_DN898_c0_g1~~TRINITY_DN898_c0_g1_i1.p1  ORF type:complete len:264 (+),score=26.29 TRINITY_DN898_c0_g1_i1:435-1226(+)